MKSTIGVSKDYGPKPQPIEKLKARAIVVFLDETVKATVFACDVNGMQVTA